MDRTEEFFSIVRTVDPTFSRTRFDDSQGAFELSATKIAETIEEFTHAAKIHRNSKVDPQTVVDSHMDAINVFKKEITFLSQSVSPPGGVANHTLESHRRSVVSYLWMTLEKFSEIVRHKQEEIMKEKRQRDTLFTEAVQSSKAAELGARLRPKVQPSSSSLPAQDSAWSSNTDNPHVSAEMSQALMTALADQTDELIDIKHKLTELAEMMSFFTQQALQQQEQCDYLLSTAEESTEIIQEADKQLKQALDRNSSSRFYQLCFYIGGAITLLVLDQIF